MNMMRPALNRRSGNPVPTTPPRWPGKRAGGTAPFDGHITEVAVFDRVLSPAEILDIMNNGLTGVAVAEAVTFLSGKFLSLFVVKP